MKFQPADFRVASEWALLAVKAMPAEQVPYNLRKIRVSSVRRLTPVQERTLYRELDKNEQLRQTTLEVLETTPSEGAHLSGDRNPRLTASRLFLARPEGWEKDVGHLLNEVKLRDTYEEAMSLKNKLSEARVEKDRLKRQVREARRLASAQSHRDTRQLCDDLERAKKRNQDLEGELSKWRQQNHRLDKELEAAFDELTRADVRVEELRRLVGKERSAHASSSSSEGNGWWGGGLSRDPVKAARVLDQMVSFWEVRSDSVPERIALSPRLELPPGMDPKSGEAVWWVYDDAPRLTLVVDGWNAAYNWNYHRNFSEPPDRGIIRFITNKLKQLAAYSVGRHLVLFYLDSEKMVGLEEGWDSRFKEGRLVGHYVENADDAIADAAAERRGEPVAVITSDNELAERCRAHGAVTLASEALAEWMSNSPV